MSDYEIFIIWNSAKKYEDEILKLISDKFRIIKIISVHWSKDRFTENLTTFYETDLRLDIGQIAMRGDGEFTVVFIEDTNPYFCIRKLNRETCDVNENVYFVKDIIRKEITGTSNVHASLNRSECQNNLVKLFGLTIDEVLRLSDNELTEYNGDCLGVGGWKCLSDVFKVLNTCFEYVVLRGGENLIDEYRFDRDGDLDILVDDLPRLSMVLNPGIERKNNYCFLNWLTINEEKIPIHAKFIGDNYYDEKWQRKIIQTRKWNGIIYVPSDEMLFWTLLYHGLFHKNNYLKYERILSDIAKEQGLFFSRDSQLMINQLSNWMRQMDYKCALHLDGSSARLNYANIPEDLLKINRKFYFYTVGLDGKPVQSLIICNELIRKNPVLFTEILKRYDLLYTVEKHILPEDTSLYRELSRKVDEGEYIWQTRIRNSGISKMVFSYKNNENGMFYKYYESTPQNDVEVEFIPEEPCEYYDGRNVDYFIIYRLITFGWTDAYQEIKNYIEEVFRKYSDDDSYLKDFTWDMLSHNCIKKDAEYFFYDFEAKNKDRIEKEVFIAYEIKHLKDIGVLRSDLNSLYKQLCTEFHLQIKHYDDIASYRSNLEYEILKMTSNVDHLIYSRYIDIPTEKSIPSELLLRDKILLFKVKDSWERFFEKFNIRRIVIYGLGKYGKILLSQLESEHVEIIACCDKNVRSYKNYTVINDISNIPQNDLIVVAILNGIEIKKKLMKNNFNKIITIEEMVNEVDCV